MSSISIHHFEVLVERFKNKEFGIEELQSRLNTALVPDQYIYEFSSKIYDLDNELELVLYTQLEPEQFQLAVNLLVAFIDFLREHDSTKHSC